MKRLGLLAALLGVALVLVGCGSEDEGVSCPTGGVSPSGAGSYADPYVIASMGTTYLGPDISNLPESWVFTAPSTGHYTGCVGTTAATDMAWSLFSYPGGTLYGTCDEWWEDNPSERCSTSEGGITLTGGQQYEIYVFKYGGVQAGATYSVTVTNP